MADNVTLPGSGSVVATDDVGGSQYQRMKLDIGGDGVAVPYAPLASGTYLASAARTATADGPTLDSGGARKVIFVYDVTAYSGAVQIWLLLQTLSPVTGLWIDLNAATVQLLNGAGPKVAIFGGADAGTPGYVGPINPPLPASFRLRSYHTTADSITYSVSYFLCP